MVAIRGTGTKETAMFDQEQSIFHMNREDLGTILVEKSNKDFYLCREIFVFSY